VNAKSKGIAEEALAVDPLGIEDVKPGAGPIMPVPVPSKWVDKASQRRMASRELERLIVEQTGNLFNAAIDLALGVSMIGEEGKIYQKPPDRETIKMLWDRGLGKPAETVNITVNGKSLDEASEEDLALALAQEGITAEEIENAVIEDD
jgi:hypothetical protein